MTYVLARGVSFFENPRFLDISSHARPICSGHGYPARRTAATAAPTIHRLVPRTGLDDPRVVFQAIAACAVVLRVVLLRAVRVRLHSVERQGFHALRPSSVQIHIFAKTVTLEQEGSHASRRHGR